MKHLVGNSKQQIIADGNSYLRGDWILVHSVERFNVQILFDPFEETFHLPTFLIKFSNRQVRMCEVVGQEVMGVSCVIVLIHKHSECVWSPPGRLLARQSDSGISYNSGTFINRMLFYHLILHVDFGPVNEEGLLAMKVEYQLLEIQIALIHKILIFRLYRCKTHSFGVIDCGFC